MSVVGECKVKIAENRRQRTEGRRQKFTHLWRGRRPKTEPRASASGLSQENRRQVDTELQIHPAKYHESKLLAQIVPMN